jgi:hypothetical protein
MPKICRMVCHFAAAMLADLPAATLADEEISRRRRIGLAATSGTGRDRSHSRKWLTARQHAARVPRRDRRIGRMIGLPRA